MDGYKTCINHLSICIKVWYPILTPYPFPKRLTGVVKIAWSIGFAVLVFSTYGMGYKCSN